MVETEFSVYTERPGLAKALAKALLYAAGSPRFEGGEHDTDGFLGLRMGLNEDEGANMRTNVGNMDDGALDARSIVNGAVKSLTPVASEVRATAGGGRNG